MQVLRVGAREAGVLLMLGTPKQLWLHWCRATAYALPILAIAFIVEDCFGVPCMALLLGCGLHMGWGDSSTSPNLAPEAGAPPTHQ